MTLKRVLVGRKEGRIGLATMSLVAVALSLGACVSPQERVERKEDDLAAAGFVVRPANTPQRQAMLKRLKPHRFFTSVQGNNVAFVYSDPTVCNCLYVGDQAAYDRYRYAAQEKKLVDQRRLTAQLYSDSGWDWNAWGPWGAGLGPDFAPGYGW